MAKSDHEIVQACFARFASQAAPPAQAVDALGIKTWQERRDRETGMRVGLRSNEAFMHTEILDLHAALAAQAAAPTDPMDWPLPCDVTVGAGTNKKGTKLPTLVTRMKMLHGMAMQVLAAPIGEPVADCHCEACEPQEPFNTRMILCGTCGNKRCPHATNHRNACTNSNEPGQKGSSWENCAAPLPQQVAQKGSDHADR
jgi:hypothetical protein